MWIGSILNLSDTEFDGLVAVDVDYLKDVDDYRSFDDASGWRHGVAHGEPRRLARPILYMAADDAFEESDWRDWFASISDPAPMADWADGYRSSAGLKRIHNLRAFALEIFAAARESGRPELEVLIEQAVLLLRKLG